jgi:hypothetical protein
MTQLEEQLPNKNRRAISLYIHRHRLVGAPAVGRNLLLEFLKHKFTDPDCFTPNRAFYKKVNVTQKRYWAIYRGESQMTDDEYLRFADFFKISLHDAFAMRQLNLFESTPNANI